MFCPVTIHEQSEFNPANLPEIGLHYYKATNNFVLITGKEIWQYGSSVGISGTKSLADLFIPDLPQPSKVEIDAAFMKGKLEGISENKNRAFTKQDLLDTIAIVINPQPLATVIASNQKKETQNVA